MKKTKNKAKNKKVTRETKDQPETNETDFVFGHHAAQEALKRARGNKLFLLKEAGGTRIEELKALAKEHSVPVKWVPKQKLDQMSEGGVHQGIVLAITPYQYLTLNELIEQSKSQPFFVLLDHIEDPHNFGSILRTADASGVDGIIIPKHRACGITPTVVKTSTGAVEYVPVARVTNLTQAVTELKEKGFWIFGTDMNGTSYHEWNAKGAIGLIIGNEGHGMNTGLKKQVDETLTIPITGHVQSLNASVASGILMYEAFVKRNE
ncbi:23S rRNA (guanosine(2251)-2'-O)-methyltransferase RlmB [Tetragenococcus halophilus]|uniref:23S rRNA (Guanosine(2251)-2'-O)-methyltransferase RlmB n=1 Tax=Tetragenococcus halophilus TaxID=51669 RepID=A0AB37D3M8_TETHA|nr:23S rRNA (guanosine(2251)-2'-O)-methyltransferase RlmB [Tetragenococcus halophilus]MCT8310332.1 23S rRNA (guanosine(2251)-2'-O)-methyltransferase RlmB [Tetragenococcus halophilus]QGP76541.1 23S rRNA (guanosine(2251)-2'-O)-methyltransferase RlmB [Tetragenococcus halophilus]GMG60528.1 23S rRNA (guanosine(2251)-2'-O)-methyltransferase RlmB [Tetragenococcus halophilus]